MILLSHADMAADVAGAETCQHVAMYIRATWCTRMRVHACVISEIKHPF